MHFDKESTGRSWTSICLNMIVRNEAHIVHELVAAVAPYISYWVIVDTGSNDGTQAVISRLMDYLQVPGELHERPWRDFGHNRSEALRLAQGKCDYIWVMDADDTVVGELDFENLSADVYSMRIKDGLLYWRFQLFRDGMPWWYKGVLHELAVCDTQFTHQRLEGDYYIHSRRLGGRSQDPNKYAKDAAILQREVDLNPGDTRSVFYLAQSYVSAGDLKNGIAWYAKRALMGGWDEEIYYSLYCVAKLMGRLNESSALVQDAYLSAWSHRPTRAEPLYEIARLNRINKRYNVGYLFAKCASALPVPEEDVLYVSLDVYKWKALDEQAVCASWIGKQAECFTICRELLSIPDVPEPDRQRIAANRDIGVPAMLAATARPSEQISEEFGLCNQNEETILLFEYASSFDSLLNTIYSFFSCCLDEGLSAVSCFVNGGSLCERDKHELSRLFPFLRFEYLAEQLTSVGNAISIAQALQYRFLFHIGSGWHFFAPDYYIARTKAIVTLEESVAQVGLNYRDSECLLGLVPRLDESKDSSETGRYVLTPMDFLVGPSLIHLERIRQAQAQASSGKISIDKCTRTATLDEVFCIKALG